MKYQKDFMLEYSIIGIIYYFDRES